jgi:hypothetical protein
MAESTAYREIGKVVDTYLLLRGLPQDDYFMYLQMACNCYRDISLNHSNSTITSKIAVSSLGIIEMPSDMVGFNKLYTVLNGEIWTFSRNKKVVTTTTTTAGIEGDDATKGEGVALINYRFIGLGARGGINTYYVNIDWKARRLFCDNFKSDTAVLVYSSNGLVVGGNTYIPSQCESPINAYIDWQREINETRSLGLLQTKEKYYNDRLFEMRLFNFLPTAEEIADIWDTNSTQSVIRG